jgi:2-polyprenyl-6-methoxyphenol hydroxylase-like FAD-dependent oxidoreductase
MSPSPSVLIVGAGPVGLTLAADLGRRGIACLVIEERADVKHHPRAMGIGPRTMEHFRLWGLDEKVYDVALPSALPGDIVYVTRICGYELARFPSPSIDEVRGRSPELLARVPPLQHSPYYRTWCAQHRLEPVLRDYAASLPPVELRFGWRFESLEQDGDGVTATVAAADGSRREAVRVRYLVGCDGARSPVRHALGIELGGRGVLGEVWGTHFRAPTLWDERTIRPGVMYWTHAPGCASVVYTLNARDEWWMNTYFRADEPFAPIDPVERLCAAVGRDVPAEVLSSRAYKAFQLVADRFRDGRAMLAGDAVHLFVPPGGLGMNTGIQDSFNLGWKLAAALRGWAGDGLVPSYEAERRPVAVRNTNRAADSYLNARDAFMVDARIDDPGPEGDRTRTEWAPKVRAAGLHQHSIAGAQLDPAYVGSPICADEKETTAERDKLAYTPAAGAGHRAPHVWLADGRSTLDLVDPEGFVLLRFGNAPRDGGAILDAAARRRVPLRAVDVPDEAAARLYGAPLVLVRPDGMVAWRGAAPADPLALIDLVRGASRPA